MSANIWKEAFVGVILEGLVQNTSFSRPYLTRALTLWFDNLMCSPKDAFVCAPDLRVVPYNTTKQYVYDGMRWVLLE